MNKMPQITHGVLFHSYCYQNLTLILIHLISCLNQTEKVKIGFLFGLVLQSLSTLKRKTKVTILL